MSAIVMYASTAAAIPIFFGVWATILWLGISMLVPQHPFHERDIATGVCLVVFSCFIGVTGGLLTYCAVYVCCWSVKKSLSACQV